MTPQQTKNKKLISGPKKHLRLESDLGNTIIKSNCCRARAHVPLIEINHNDFNWKKRWENISPCLGQLRPE